MNDTKRTIAAGLLIGLLTLFIPFYLRLIGIAPEEDFSVSSSPPIEPLVREAPGDENLGSTQERPIVSLLDNSVSSIDFSIITDKYLASMSSLSGGSFLSFEINSLQKDGYRYKGGYNESGEYDPSADVNLMFSSPGPCSPCLSSENTLFDKPFELLSPSISSGQIFNLYDSDSLVVKMRFFHNGYNIYKTTTFYADSYIIKHDFIVDESPGSLFVLWNDGILPTEKNLYEELTYSSAYIGQSKEISDITLNASSLEDHISKESFVGKTDWVAIRNKYFINSFISSQATGGSLEGRSVNLNADTFIPAYAVGLKFDSSSFSLNQFFGPLDVDIITSSNTYLDRVMNFGWLPIQPFSRSVLWILKKLHLLGLNYGVILILFAFLIRIITGPLTKKSYQSTLKMQKIQPQMKKIQEKYKNDSQRLNREMMNLYKTSGVNPLGGCFPMLVQMPLLFSLFIVFRSTIEFRGAPFFGWINNLSQPDTIFNLPFNVPIYGDQVAFLPIVLGVSMFLTQRLSMATMDKSQKPMIYMMSAFFFLLFNSFPSGLNLYYTIYNFLNYFQQKSLKGK
tara:strand:+ start:360 stop:2057 length:1698 start_codon:yes stop_codon:yes gene_type:complete